MGMYTKLYLDIELIKETPQEIIETLYEMTDPGKECNFWNNRLNWCLKGTSAYFNETVMTKFWKNYDYGVYKLFVNCDFKNYDEEIETLLKWLYPYINKDYRMLGFTLYEDDDVPRIIYLNNYEARTMKQQIKDKYYIIIVSELLDEIEIMTEELE